MSVDWTKPLEAIRERDATAWPVTFVKLGLGAHSEQQFETTAPAGGGNGYWHPDGRGFCTTERWHIRNVQSDELTELRKFKARALELHPDLAEPETDEEAADSILASSPAGCEVRAMLLRAIAWARSNPRDK